MPTMVRWSTSLSWRKLLVLQKRAHTSISTRSAWRQLTSVDSNTKSNWFQQYSDVHFLHPLPYYKQYSIQYTILCCPYAASQADTDPTSDLGTNFDGLDAREKRDEVVKDKQLDKPSMNKFVQDGSPVLYHLSGFISICLPWYILSRIILLEENTLIVTWHRPCKTKATLRTFLTSMMSKSGKLRSLVRDLKKTYCDSATSACLIQKKI